MSKENNISSSLIGEARINTTSHSMGAIVTSAITYVSNAVMSITSPNLIAFIYHYRLQAKVMLCLMIALTLFAVTPLYAGGTHDSGHHHTLDDGVSVAYNSYVSDSREVVFSIAQLGEPLAAIIGGCVRVKTLLGSGTDPHLYRLSRADVLTMHKANIIMNLGLHLELQMQPVLMDMSLFKSVYSLGDMMPTKSLIDVSPLVYDPHLWMDPSLWLNVVALASEQVAKNYPECKDKIMAGLQDYAKEIYALDRQAKKIFQTIPAKNRVLVTSHDAFGYFGRKYDIEVLAIQGISTDRQISIRRISQLIDFLVDNDIRVVFVESSVNPRDMEAVIEGAASRGYKITIGGTLYSDAMGAEGTAEGTYLGMLRHNMSTILDAWNVKGHPFSNSGGVARFL